MKMTNEELKEAILNGSIYDPTDSLKHGFKESGMDIDNYIAYVQEKISLLN